MKHLDLFSGIGGFALAAERVWGDVEHTFCDNDPFCQAVLKKHWPDAKIYEDIRTLTADAECSRHVHGQPQEQSAISDQQAQREPVAGVPAPFILTGGFPCQPFSQAGRRRGTQDDRYLWPEMLRVIREFSPRWVVGENVGGFVTWNGGMVLRQVLADLEGEGYEVQAFIIPAVAVNAPHRRDRVWIVANRKGIGREQGSENAGRTPEGAAALRTVRSRPSNSSDVANASSERLERGERKQPLRHGGQPDRNGSDERWSWNQNWFEVATELCRVDDGIPRKVDGVGELPTKPTHEKGKAAGRAHRLKALGNAIVPQVAEQIFRAIKAVNPIWEHSHLLTNEK